jgi:16S rRNA (cytosine1402-N4)-methyltransferase
LKLNSAHIPVLLDKVLETLGDVAGRTIVDATLGAGGYAREFLKRGARVVSFDRDPSVQPFADKLKSEYGDDFQFINAPFSEISNLGRPISDIVFDLGVSSMQIDAPERGFSWRFDAPLDMRMGAGRTAAELIERSSVGELSQILREFGDVKKAHAIARAMKYRPPKTTFELRDLIYNPKDVAPVFQALRIAANDELNEIRRALDAVPDLLSAGGMCVCVTFHSLEDRIVKGKFYEWTAAARDPKLPPPPGNCGPAAMVEPLKTFRPDERELENNPRSRSSHLRAVRKTCNMAKKET